ncbi:MAG: hypothetical protein K2X77_06580 [Candidatus Obscuribacterales bacterium]|nr:hypothetical protein [Candidatus Obscuribacterales bacterium]
MPSQPMDEGQTFPSSSQQLSLKQQVIALSQSYPCPRCTPGVLEPYGHTETMMCASCKRSFVPLRGGRLLYPANSMGFKIAPTFWWDGYRWHWGGTTATAKQLCVIVLLSLMPVFGILLASKVSTFEPFFKQCYPALLAPLVGLLTMQLIYACCWDFEFCSTKRTKRQRTT